MDFTSTRRELAARLLDKRRKISHCFGRVLVSQERERRNSLLCHRARFLLIVSRRPFLAIRMHCASIFFYDSFFRLWPPSPGARFNSFIPFFFKLPPLHTRSPHYLLIKRFLFFRCARLYRKTVERTLNGCLYCVLCVSVCERDRPFFLFTQTDYTQYRKC